MTGYDKDGFYVVQIQDRGPGIPEYLRQKIGEPFLRGGDAYTKNIEGTGLGLAITKMLLASQNGRLMIDDRPGGGARVRIVLPR